MIKFLYRLFLAITLTAVVAVIALRISAANRENLAASDMLLPESEIVQTAHGALHALQMGPVDGQPILLVHGAVGWSGLWRPTMNVLVAQGYRAIALDLPPMGLSARDTRMDFSRQAQALRIRPFRGEVEICQRLEEERKQYRAGHHPEYEHDCVHPT